MVSEGGAQKRNAGEHFLSRMVTKIVPDPQQESCKVLLLLLPSGSPSHPYRKPSLLINLCLNSSWNHR